MWLYCHWQAYACRVNSTLEGQSRKMANETYDHDLDAVRSTIPTRQGIVELVREGYNYSQAAKMMGVSRQRAWAICQQEGMIRSASPRYPRIRACMSTKAEVTPHTFLAYNDRNLRCLKHRRRATVKAEARYDHA